METLSIIIPVYNEEKNLPEVLKRVEAVNIGDVNKEIILIDDCSKDGSRDIINSLSDRYVKIFHEINKGKGTAVRNGLKKATGDFAIIQDADLEYSIENYPALLFPILSRGYDVIFGNRYYESNRHIYSSFYYGVRFLSFVSNIINRQKLSDIYVGYKVFNRRVINYLAGRLVSNRFAVEAEITARLRKFKIAEVPIYYKPRSFKEGKKIRWIDGLKGLMAVLYFGLIDMS
ncbi:MAG: family 2 glycosyl transferase [Parcubacteria group bacterium Licking1014_17]|nr:MAG: family 2 glycosyl transferase [Parcubacteria group bacterium Licking1014_17]